jgi:hypothetical protein
VCIIAYYWARAKRNHGEGPNDHARSGVREFDLSRRSSLPVRIALPPTSRSLVLTGSTVVIQWDGVLLLVCDCFRVTLQEQTVPVYPDSSRFLPGPIAPLAMGPACVYLSRIRIRIAVPDLSAWDYWFAGMTVPKLLTVHIPTCRPILAPSFTAVRKW